MQDRALHSNKAVSWEEELSESYRSLEDLVNEGFLLPSEAMNLRQVAQDFKILLPRYYASLIDKRNPKCPIRLQALPNALEQVTPEGFKEDPLEDRAHKPAPRITHRYPGRVLLHLTQACSMYCRFCFRKTLLNDLAPELFSGDVAKSFEYISSHHEIEEVIFSGGDPFLLKDSALRISLERLSSFAHIKRVRFHTRVPVTFPSRVTESLASVFTDSKLPIVVVTHFNHPKEITQQSQKAIALLKRSCAAVLNQSVLLRNVNDDVEVLKPLMEQLFEIGVMPYYLHHPDRAAGTSHFDLPIERGREIYHRLRSSLPGYLTPRYVLDEVGAPYKTSL